MTDGSPRHDPPEYAAPARTRDSGTEEDEQHLSVDAIMGILADRRRRRMLYILRDRDGPIELSELAERVALRGNGGAPSDGSDERLRSVSASLYHSHVPRLVDANVVTYDERRGTVTLSENGEHLDAFLDFTARHEP